MVHQVIRETLVFYSLGSGEGEDQIKTKVNRNIYIKHIRLSLILVYLVNLIKSKNAYLNLPPMLNCHISY